MDRRLETLLAQVNDVDLPMAPLDEVALLQEAADWEVIGRAVDAHRVKLTAEVAVRSRPELGSAGLAAKYGKRNGSQLLESELLISVGEAKRRIRIGSSIAPRTTLTGETLPALHPAVAAAMIAGNLGVGSAEVIIAAIESVGGRADPDALVAAESMLVGHAEGLTPAQLSKTAAYVVAHLDPDGVVPREAAQQARRSVTLGRQQADGMAHLSGWLTPEAQATVRALFESARRGVEFQRIPDTVTGEDTFIDTIDHRSGPQVDHDTLLHLLEAGARATAQGAAGPILGGIETEVVIVATVDQIEARRAAGHGFIEHLGVPIPLPAVERVACTGGTRLVVTGVKGETMHFGMKHRLFSRHQKKALAIRDGGCAWPGCTAPVAWTEAHHIRWYERDHGPTDINNGILLCSFHHHRIHAPDTPVQIVLHKKQPHLVPLGWRGAPEPRHQMQRHPIAAVPPGDPARARADHLLPHRPRGDSAAA